jgi:hypothetical protein
MSSPAVGRLFEKWHSADGAEHRGLISTLPLAPWDSVLGNPQIVPRDDGSWIIGFYGGGRITGPPEGPGDSIAVILRQPTGYYELAPNGYQTVEPEYESEGKIIAPALAFPKAAPGKSWTTIGGLGCGAGMAASDRATFLGYRYFAVVPIGLGNVDTPLEAEASWVSWAVSKDGIRWSFVADDGIHITDNPAISIKLISEPSLTPYFWHTALAYSQQESAFYAVIGYGEIGIKATWWRIGFDPGKPFGVGGQIAVLQGKLWVENGGVISDAPGQPKGAWSLAAAVDLSPHDAVDPYCLLQLRKADGSFDGWLFAYNPIDGPFDAPSKIALVRGSSPVWPLFTVADAPALLDTSAIQAAGYNGTSAGGGAVGIVQARPGGQLYGFFSTGRKKGPDWPVDSGMETSAAGLLAAELKGI